MLPTLQFLADGHIHSVTELHDKITAQFKMTEAEISVRVPSRQLTRIRCNLSWTCTHLKKAGLIASPSRANYQITDAGLQLLNTHPTKISTKTLEQFPAYKAWLVACGKKHTSDAHTPDADPESSSITPDEAIGKAYEELRTMLANDLLDKILEQSPYFFEKLVVKLLVAMGYGGSYNELSEMMVGQVGDEGIDGIIKEDKLGLDNIYVQAKRWDKSRTVGRPDIQQFVGALAGKGANKGIYITTAHFSEQARSFKPQNNIKVALIDGKSLCQHMIDYNIGVATKEVYEIKRIDQDFFSDEE